MTGGLQIIRQAEVMPMNVKLDVEKIRFRQGDKSLSATRQLEIAARRIAGCQRVLRQGDPLRDLENIMAMRGVGAPEGLVTPWPVHPPEPYRVKSVELRTSGWGQPWPRSSTLLTRYGSGGLTGHGVTSPSGAPTPLMAMIFSRSRRGS